MPSSDKPTVVLLHSSASSARQWDALTQALTPRFRVEAIDLYGHGKQPPWYGEAPVTLADEARLATPTISRVGAVHVVGHSYGGAVALKLASMYPASVLSVAVYEPVLFRWLTDDIAQHPAVRDVIAVADSMCEYLWEGDEESAARVFVDFWSGTGAWDSLPTGARCNIAGRIRIVSEQFDALFHEPMLRAQLGRLRMPMLFMTGARTEPVMRSLADVLRLTFPGAGHELMSSMGHMGPITHAKEVNRRLSQFLHTHALPEDADEPLSELA